MSYLNICKYKEYMSIYAFQHINWERNIVLMLMWLEKIDSEQIMIKVTLNKIKQGIVKYNKDTDIPNPARHM